MQHRIACDVDGVIADFTSAYAAALTKHTGITFPTQSDTWPSEWFWERREGVTPSQEKKVWQEEILTNGTFWSGLDELPGAREAIRKLNRLANAGTAEVCFITNRPGKRSKHQTEIFLYALGMSYPTVLVAADKLPLLRAMNITFFIDDKPETVQEVSAAKLDLKLYLKDAPYNRQQSYPDNVKRIPSLLDALKDAYGV